MAAKLPYGWATVARTCRGATSGSCGAPDEVCAPPAPAGFEQCLFQSGDADCPVTYPVRHTFYSTFDDSRDCTPCACGAPVGSTCMTMLSTFTDGACSSPLSSNTIDATGPTCLDVMPSGQALGSKQASAPVYAPGVCQASGGQPVGNAVPAEPTTFCCLP